MATSSYLITYPAPLLNKLRRNADLAGPIIGLQASFGRALAHSHLPFFPGYTDHGIEHIAAVMDLAECLRTKASNRVFTSADAATLILAVLLHDIGMHLTEDGFARLIDPKNTKPSIPEFDTLSWPELWEAFLQEASRFDDRTWIKITGESDPVRIDAAASEWENRREKLLIGEFIRRHHPRIAHESALHGIPGVDDNPIDFSHLPEHVRDLAGLVARSHGMSLRECLGYKKHVYGGLREYQGIHAPYLMALLRVADVLQIQPERAPGEVLKMKRLPSPLSVQEWRVHQSVTNISYNDGDEEAIRIDAHPTDVRTFLRLKEWLGWIQNEMDQSWAVLGEVYSRYGKNQLNKLEMNLRRVYSNLDDVKEFGKHIDYIPERLVFDTAGPRLLKLLIGPLYGDRPEIGIRELLTNSLDAVREREHYQKKHPDHKLDLMDLGIDDTDGVVIDIDIALEEDPDGKKWVIVSDRGIGMTLELIRDYFLKAGASFRDSELWKKENLDASGKSEVLRTGRFGIGAFAAFLIGDRIEVTTRHISESRGLKFTASIEDDPIEVHRVENCPAGTTIRVVASIKAYDFLEENNIHSEVYMPLDQNWDWYCLKLPRVRRRIGKYALQQTYVMQWPNNEISTIWKSISLPKYSDIVWTLHKDMPNFTNNGILISRRGLNSWQNPWQFPFKFGCYEISVPRIAVFDDNCSLPLTLDRLQLTSKINDIIDEVEHSVKPSFMAALIVMAPTAILGQCFKYSLPIDASHYYRFQNYIAPLDLWCLSKSNIESVLFVPPYRFMGESVFAKAITNGNSAIMSIDMSVSSYTGFIKGLCDTISRLQLQEKPSEGKVPAFRLLTEVNINKHRDFDDLHMIPEWSIENFTLWRFGDCPDTKVDFKVFFPNASNGYVGIFADIVECYIDAKIISSNPESDFAKMWRELVGDNFEIPYDLSERRAQFPQAYETLAPYMVAIEAENGL